MAAKIKMVVIFDRNRKLSNYKLGWRSSSTQILIHWKLLQYGRKLLKLAITFTISISECMSVALFNAAWIFILRSQCTEKQRIRMSLFDYWVLTIYFAHLQRQRCVHKRSRFFGHPSRKAPSKPKHLWLNISPRMIFAALAMMTASSLKSRSLITSLRTSCNPFQNTQSCFFHPTDPVHLWRKPVFLSYMQVLYNWCVCVFQDSPTASPKTNGYRHSQHSLSM